jgi:hypothetical protein
MNVIQRVAVVIAFLKMHQRQTYYLGHFEKNVQVVVIQEICMVITMRMSMTEQREIDSDALQ